MALAPAQASQQDRSVFRIGDLPNELSCRVVDLVVQDDHTRSDVISLLLVNKSLHNIVKKRVHAQVTFLYGQGRHPASDAVIMPLRIDNWLPSMLRGLTLCHHGPCAHDQHRLGLTSPNIGIQTLWVMPSKIDLALKCQGSCTPVPVLSPRTMVISNPGTTAQGRVHQGVAPDAVKHLVHIIGHQAIEAMPNTIQGISWYHREFNKVETVAVVFAPHEEAEQEWYGAEEIHQFQLRAVQIMHVLETYRQLMVNNEHLQLSLVNLGSFHSLVVKHFCRRRERTTAGRQYGIAWWFACNVVHWGWGLQSQRLLRRAKFMTVEEYNRESEQSLNIVE